jgi:predicted nucleic acid-binding protein
VALRALAGRASTNDVAKPSRIMRVRVVTSAPLLDELARVLARPRLQRIRPFREAEATLYVLLIQARARVVDTTDRLRVCRDPTDDDWRESNRADLGPSARRV